MQTCAGKSSENVEANGSMRDSGEMSHFRGKCVKLWRCLRSTEQCKVNISLARSSRKLIQEKKWKRLVKSIKAHEERVSIGRGKSSQSFYVYLPVSRSRSVVLGMGVPYVSVAHD